MYTIKLGELYLDVQYTSQVSIAFLSPIDSGTRWSYDKDDKKIMMHNPKYPMLYFDVWTGITRSTPIFLSTDTNTSPVILTDRKIIVDDEYAIVKGYSSDKNFNLLQKDDPQASVWTFICQSGGIFDGDKCTCPEGAEIIGDMCQCTVSGAEIIGNMCQCGDNMIIQNKECVCKYKNGVKTESGCKCPDGTVGQVDKCIISDITLNPKCEPQILKRFGDFECTRTNMNCQDLNWDGWVTETYPAPYPGSIGGWLSRYTLFADAQSKGVFPTGPGDYCYGCDDKSACLSNYGKICQQSVIDSDNNNPELDLACRLGMQLNTTDLTLRRQCCSDATCGKTTIPFEDLVKNCSDWKNYKATCSHTPKNLSCVFGGTGCIESTDTRETFYSSCDDTIRGLCKQGDNITDPNCQKWITTLINETDVDAKTKYLPTWKDAMETYCFTGDNIITDECIKMADFVKDNALISDYKIWDNHIIEWCHGKPTSEFCLDYCKRKDPGNTYFNCDNVYGGTGYCYKQELSTMTGSYEEICGCFLPTSEYQKYYGDLKNFGITTNVQPECTFPLCAASELQPYKVKNSVKPCPNIEQCIQIVNIDDRGKITGDVYVSQLQDCGFNVDCFNSIPHSHQKPITPKEGVNMVGCVCDDTFISVIKDNKKSCVCPDGAVVSGDECVCNISGSIIQDGKCVCPNNTTLSISGCVCNAIGAVLGPDHTCVCPDEMTLNNDGTECVTNFFDKLVAAFQTRTISLMAIIVAVLVLVTYLITTYGKNNYVNTAGLMVASFAAILLLSVYTKSGKFLKYGLIATIIIYTIIFALLANKS